MGARAGHGRARERTSGHPPARRVILEESKHLPLLLGAHADRVAHAAHAAVVSTASRRRSAGRAISVVVLSLPALHLRSVREGRRGGGVSLGASAGGAVARTVREGHGMSARVLLQVESTDRRIFLTSEESAARGVGLAGHARRKTMPSSARTFPLILLCGPTE